MSVHITISRSKDGGHLVSLGGFDHEGEGMIYGQFYEDLLEQALTDLLGSKRTTEAFIQLNEEQQP